MRIFYFLMWVPRYGYELLRANWSLAKTLFLVPNSELRPSFFAYDVSQLRDFEKFLLSHLITLTPGTTSADLEDQGRTLIVHGIDIGDVRLAREDIDLNLREPLLRWTRS